MQTLVMSALVPEHQDTARSVIDVAQDGILGLPFLLAPAFVLGGVLFAVSLLLVVTPVSSSGVQVQAVGSVR